MPEIIDLTYEERLRELNLPTLEYRRRRGYLIQMFKILLGIDDIDSYICENVTRCHSLKLNKPLPRCSKSYCRMHFLLDALMPRMLYQIT